MTRRNFGTASILAVGAVWDWRAMAQSSPSRVAPGTARPGKPEPVTKYVSEFIATTRYSDIPGEVIELSRKSMLDGLGLALCGSVAETGDIVRNYLKSRGLISTDSNAATVIGSS